MNEKKAIKLLKKYSSYEKSFKAVLKHSKAVQRVALKLSKKIGNEVDLELVKIGALLHDIGRFKCPPWKDSVRHGVEGAKILRKEKLMKEALIAERHLGVGITKKDIKKQRLDLPLKDYVPKSIEEKIISYSDNLIFGDKVKKEKDVIKRFEKELGKYMGKRILKFNKGISLLINSKDRKV